MVPLLDAAWKLAEGYLWGAAIFLAATWIITKTLRD
jgi:hypothetical protein